MWTGIGLCAAGAAGLVVGAVLDVEAADPWASVAGGVAALIGLALAVYAGFQGQDGTSGGTTVNASGTRSVAAGGNIGTVSTGDGPGAPASAPPANPSPAPAPPQPRNVTASGERSIAAGGDIGSASTGDT
ncbi:hypothetical protein SCNRRL3882_3659 [Streptomyces chartreusis NRRL 3882]|uniref:Uncharacterized protein n=2 Tax=Streptomyces TaxID=1883 RepID=A0A2N9BA33_STRCX|nr:hypothetical protein [Streptomyces sp. SID5464]SOR80203.1 hypothetical protein SCNRRL3882_3659 [Streptomyces chartreusis NRRL 3882]